MVVYTPAEPFSSFFAPAFVAAVIIEKPLTPTFAEAQELDALAKTKNLVLATYQNRRWDSDFLTVKAMIEDGTFGELSEFEVSPSSPVRLKPSSPLADATLSSAPSLTLTDTETSSPPLEHGRRRRRPESEQSTTSGPTSSVSPLPPKTAFRLRALTLFSSTDFPNLSSTKLSSSLADPNPSPVWFATRARSGTPRSPTRSTSSVGPSPSF